MDFEDICSFCGRTIFWEETSAWRIIGWVHWDHGWALCIPGDSGSPRATPTELHQEVLV